MFFEHCLYKKHVFYVFPRCTEEKKYVFYRIFFGPPGKPSDPRAGIYDPRAGIYGWRWSGGRLARRAGGGSRHALEVSI